MLGCLKIFKSCNVEDYTWYTSGYCSITIMGAISEFASLIPGENVHLWLCQDNAGLLNAKLKMGKRFPSHPKCLKTSTLNSYKFK